MCKLSTHTPSALKYLLTGDIYFISESKSLSTVETSIRSASEKWEPKDTDLSHLSKAQVSPKEEPYFDYLGENNTYFLLLIEDKQHAQISSTRLETLLKIMQAKGLALKDLAILNKAHYPNASFDDLKAFFACTKLALFGINPQQLGLTALSVNKPEIFQGVKIMASYSLAEMDLNQDKKREFWNVMKKF